MEINQKEKVESEQQSMYVPQMESDACGIGLITQIKGEKSHQLVDNALTMLERMEHRGATGAEANSGDGSGISLQLPHSFFQGFCQKRNIDLPAFGRPTTATTQENINEMHSVVMDDRRSTVKHLVRVYPNTVLYNGIFVSDTIRYTQNKGYA